MNTIEAILARRSVRAFAAQDIEEDKLKKILHCATVAPKSGEFRITVVRNKGVLDNLDENLVNYMKDNDNPAVAAMASTPGFKALYGAPCIVFFSVPEENPGTSTVSADLAAENLCLAAVEEGLGSCYMMTPVMCNVINPLFKDVITVPEGFEIYSSVVLGYAADEPMARADSDGIINYFD